VEEEISQLIGRKIQVTYRRKTNGEGSSKPLIIMQSFLLVEGTGWGDGSYLTSEALDASKRGKAFDEEGGNRANRFEPINHILRKRAADRTLKDQGSLGSTNSNRPT